MLFGPRGLPGAIRTTLSDALVDEAEAFFEQEMARLTFPASS